MITELQKRFEADAYKQKMNYAGSAGIAAEQGFLAGIDFLQHLLQQTPCTTQLSPVKDFKCANCDFTCNTLESLSWHKAECVWARIAWYDKAWGWFGF